MIFVSAHFANWEVMPVAAAQYSVEVGAVYRPVNNPFVDRWLVRQRQRNGPKEQIAKGAHGTRRIFTLLRAGKSICMLVDQKTNEGVAAPFFGRDAMTTPAPAALALKLGAVIVPVSNERLDGAHFRVTVHPAIEAEATTDHVRDVLALTTRVNEAIEACVRYRPSQWLWIHRRWPRPGERPRSRRGRAAQAFANQPEAELVTVRRRLMFASPDAKSGAGRDCRKIGICGQHGQIMPDTQLRQKSIDRSDLHASASAAVPQLCCLYVIVPVGCDQRQCRKAFDDLRARFRSGKSLQQLLQDKAGGQKRLTALDATDQFPHLRHRRGGVTSQGQRPHARVHEDAHPRERSAL